MVRKDMSVYGFGIQRSCQNCEPIPTTYISVYILNGSPNDLDGLTCAYLI